MSVGLVHDYLLVMRGAERTFAEMAAVWPDAPIYTTLYDPAGTEQRFDGRDIRTSFLQRTGAKQDGFRKLLPLFPAAVARLPVGGHDVVVSSSSAFAHGVHTREDAVHVCYCHAPFRYAWHEREIALAEIPPALRVPARVVFAGIRRWDRRASQRVTEYVANSEFTRARIFEFYGREAQVVHPPVDVARFPREGTDHEDWFLIVSALVGHKRVDRALAAARAAGRRVKVVGDGPERARWEREYGDVAEFLGRVGDSELVELYRHALALVVPSVEEFGITAVEAQAAGRPVLAIAEGGALETVIPGRTGELVDVGSLAEAMREVSFDRFDPAAARANAARFSPDVFRAAMRAATADAVAART